MLPNWILLQDQLEGKISSSICFLFLSFFNIISIFFNHSTNTLYDMPRRRVVLHGKSISDKGWQRTIVSALKKAPTEFTIKGSPVSIEIRSCGGLEIDHVVGPVLSEEDYFRITGKSLTEALVDDVHIKTTLEAIKRNVKFTSISGSTQVFDGLMDSFSKQLSLNVPPTVRKDKSFDVASSTLENILTSAKRLSQSTAGLYALGRTDPNCTITAQFSLNKSFVEQHRGRREELKFAYFQYIVRLDGLSPYERLRYERRPNDAVRSKKTTRVWTCCIPLTYDIPSYLLSLNERVWALSIGRSFAADLHSAMLFYISRTSSPEFGQFSSPGKLRSEFAGAVDYLVQDIVKHWYQGYTKTISSTCSSLDIPDRCGVMDKIVSTCKMLYLLREGPCLGGQLMDLQEAYLVRSYFLTCSLQQAELIMCPRLHIFLPAPPAMIYSPRDGKVKLTPNPVCVEGSPTVMSFFPSTCVTLDAGDAIYVWVGSTVSDNNSTASSSSFSGEACEFISDLAQSLALSRYPIPSVKIISTSLTSGSLSFDERFVFSRLLPGQNDSREVQLYSLASVCCDLQAMEAPNETILGFLGSITAEVLDAMQERASPTEQASFHSYMSKHAFKVSMYLRKQGRIGILSFPQLVRLCPTSLDDPHLHMPFRGTEPMNRGGPPVTKQEANWKIAPVV